jgi:hypothetical protein
MAYILYIQSETQKKDDLFDVYIFHSRTQNNLLGEILKSMPQTHIAYRNKLVHPRKETLSHTLKTTAPTSMYSSTRRAEHVVLENIPRFYLELTTIAYQLPKLPDQKSPKPF